MSSDEYLRVVDQLIKCRDDETFHTLQAKLKQVIGSESRRMLAESGFIERYKRLEASCHLHTFGKGNLNLCAVLYRSSSPDMVATSDGDIEPHLSLPFGDMQVSMFVDVRECSENSHLKASIPTIVRLQSLDDCERGLADTGEAFLEKVVGQRKIIRDGRVPFSGYVNQQGELAAFLPTGGKLDTSGIHFDKIERQVIECRPHLIKRFASKHRNTRRRGNSEVQLILAVRLLRDSARLLCQIIPDGLTHRFDMFRCPDEFEFC